MLVITTGPKTATSFLATLNLYTGTSSSFFGSGSSNFTGFSPTVPDNLATGHASVFTVSADTDYNGQITTTGDGDVISAVVYEEMKPGDTIYGYLPKTDMGIASGPIYDAHRQDVVVLMNKQWKRGGGFQLNWSNTTGIARASVAADKNIVDNTSTTVTAATPGYTCDLTSKASLSRAAAGIDCIIAGYATNTGTVGNQGVKLKNSAGTTIVTLTGGWSGTPGWYTQAFKIPAGIDKYDLQAYSNNGTLTLYAVSIYEYL
jgi:hypothetical protein